MKKRKKKLRKRSQPKENDNTKRNKIQQIGRDTDVLKVGWGVPEQSIIEKNNAFAELLES